MKVIKVDTPKGQYSIPLEDVAKNRADYYACEVDGHEKDSVEYNEEVELAMQDDFEAIDWVLNNSNWEDWESIAAKLNDDILVTDEDFWTSSDNFVITDEDRIELKEYDEFKEARKKEWLDENAHKSQILGNKLLPMHPNIGFYFKVNDLDISEDFFKEEFDQIYNAYFSVLKKLEEHYKEKKKK